LAIVLLWLTFFVQTSLPVAAIEKPKAQAAARNSEGSPDRNTLGIIGGTVEGGGLRFLTDIAKRVVARQETGPRGELALRLWPVLGRGGIHDIRDVLAHRSGVDMALTHEHVINGLQQSRALGDLTGKLVYVTRLFYEELHLIAAPGVAQITDLAGKPVNVGEYGSSVESLVRILFRDLEIPITEVHLDEADALEKVQAGTIAATAILAAKPATAVERLARESGVRLLPIPYRTEGAEAYLPATLKSEDYPDLIPPGPGVKTITVRTVLMAYNWPQESRRYRLMRDFVDLFFPTLLNGQGATPSSNGVELPFTEALPGWQRFRPAERWVQSWQAQVSRTPEWSAAQDRSGQGPLQSEGTRTGSVRVPSNAEDPAFKRLMEEFLRWKQQRKR